MVTPSGGAGTGRAGRLVAGADARKRRVAALAVAMSFMAVPLLVGPFAGPSSGATEAAFDESSYREFLMVLSADPDGPHVLHITDDFSIMGLAPEDPAYTGIPPLTIVGNGHTITAGIDDMRLLFHNAAAELTIVDLTVVGFDRSDDGGAIRADGDVTITDSRFEDNTARAGSSGGALHADGEVTISGSVFEANTAHGSGGAVHTDGDVSVDQDSTLSGNWAFEGDGGAIRAGGAVTVTDSALTDNVTLDGDGGAVHAVEPVTITSSTLSTNTAFDGDGGAVRGIEAVTITGSTLNGNRAEERGGAVRAGGDVQITNSDLGEAAAPNVAAEGDGGAVDGDGDVTVTSDSTLSGNIAGGSGGAIRAVGTVTVTNSTLSANRAEGASGPGEGGAIRTDGDLTITNGQLHGNEAVGGGGAVWADEDVTIRGDSTLSLNEAGGGGGAVHTGEAATIRDSTLADNTAEGNGGAVRAFGTVTVEQDSTLRDNRTNDGNGGAVHSLADVTVTDSTLTDNRAAGAGTAGNGGAIDAFFGAVTVTNSTISGNRALDGDGGGVRAFGTVEVSTDSTLHDNIAAAGGGGVSTSGDVTVTSSTLSENRADDGNGGAARAGGPVTITDSTLRQNTASGGSGGAVFTTGSVTVEGGSLSDNTATQDGGGIAVRGEPDSNIDVTLTGGAAQGNDAFDDGDVVYARGAGNADVAITVTDTVLPGNPAGARPLHGVADGGAVVVEIRNTGTSLQAVTASSPASGPVEVGAFDTVSAPPNGFDFVDRKADVEAAGGTVGAPVTITFRVLDPPLAPGQDEGDVVVFRDGVLVEDCDDAGAGVPEPDPCVDARQTAGGEVTLTVLTTQASVWHPAVRLPPDVELVGLEVNQAIQSWDSSIPLIEGKLTAVRAFAQMRQGVAPQRVVGFLHGSRDGADLPLSPLRAINFSEGAPAGSLLLSEDVAARRGTLWDSFNFRLPPQWERGTVTLRFEARDVADDPISVTCQEVAAPEDTCSAEARFREANPLDVKIVSVPYVDADGTRQEPTLPALIEQRLRTRNTLPVSHVSGPVADLSITQTRRWFSTTRPPHEFPTRPWLGEVNAALETMRMLDQAPQGRLYYGLLAGWGNEWDDGSTQTGLANAIPGTASSAFLMQYAARNATGFLRNIAPHEIGHTLGRHHAVHSTVPLEPGDEPGSVRGWCGEIADPGAPDYPYWAAVDGQLRALIAPIGDRDTEIWGMDPRFLSILPGIREDGLALVNPRTTFALMSYCAPVDADGQGWWIDRDTYTQLASQFGVTATATAAAASPAQAAPTDYLIVRGIIDFESDATGVTPAAVSFPPPLPLTSTEAPPGMDDGDFTMVLKDTAGDELLSVSFEPIEMDEGPPLDGSGTFFPPTGLFLVPIEDPGQDLAEVEILFDGAPLASLVASAGPPVVAITEPVAGQVFDGESVTIRWAASDPDGDQLSYTVQHSADDGVTWETLAVDVTGDELTVARHWVSGSTTARIRVIASDGLHHATALSDRFTIDDNPPHIVIVSPDDGDHVVSGQLLSLEAVAIDKEEGDLSGAGIEWSSDLDGPLGTGERLDVPAAGLTLGTHEVAATATDSAGNTAWESVTVTITDGSVPDPGPGPGPGAGPGAGPVPGPGPEPDADDEPGPGRDDDAEPGTVVERMAGETRIHTAVAISQHRFPDPPPGAVGLAAARPDVVVIARADDYADASVGGPLAAHLGAPLLLTGRDGLHAVTAAEVDRLGVDRAILLGGRRALSARVVTDLAALRVTAERISGSDRFATAAAVAARLPASTHAWIAEGAHPDPGRGWPDALTAAGAAAGRAEPVLLVLRDRLPEATDAALDGFEAVTIVGGSAAVTPAVEAALAARGLEVRRLAGATRYETALAVVDRTVADGADPGQVWVATGTNWPDALAGGPAAAAARGVLTLVDGRDLHNSPALADWLARHRPARLVLLGGPGAISLAAEQQLRAAVGAP